MSVDIETLRAIYGDDPTNWPPTDWPGAAPPPKEEPEKKRWHASEILMWQEIQRLGKELVKRAGHPIPIVCTDGRS